jgi:putative protease
MSKIELVAPVSTPKMLRAAIEFGADAVYFGGNNFNARLYARNFNDKEIKDSIDAAHLQGVKTYIVVNTLIKNSELNDLFKFLKLVYESGADSLIITDFAVLSIVRQYFPDIRVHASTQMGVHNTQAALFLQKKGFERVILARELTSSEIAEISKRTDVELEVFAHGALCYFFSGQCYFSSMVGGRSGNRGRCAQPCRLKYALECDGKPGKCHALSKRDLCLLGSIPQLVRSGVNAIKIEGRMKTAEYVAVVVETYRKAIDRYYRDPEGYKADPGELMNIEQIFSRGFTQGNFGNEIDRNIVQPMRGGNIGLFIGRVRKIEGEAAVVHSVKEIEAGDELEFWTGSGCFLQRIKKDDLVRLADRSDEFVYRIKVIARTGLNDRVFMLEDHSQLARIADMLRRPYILRKVSVNVSVSMRTGEPVTVSAQSADGFEVKVISDIPVQPSKKHVLQIDEVRDVFLRLGSTPYGPGNITVLLDKGSFFPLSELKSLRRRLFEDLNRARLESSKRKFTKEMACYPLRRSPRRSGYRKPGISVEVKNADQAMAAVTGGADLIYCEVGLGQMRDPGQIEEFFERVASAYDRSVSMAICFPNLIFDQQFELAYHFLRSLNPRIKKSYGYLRLNNLGLFNAALSFVDLKIAIDYNMNIMNNLAANEVDMQNLKIITPSIEMSVYELSDLHLPDGTELELFAHGPIKVGTARVDIIRSLPEYVDRSCRELVLADEKGYSFPIKTDDGISELYNSVPLCILRNLPEMVKINPSFFRINAKHYVPEEGKAIIATYKEALNILEEGDEAEFRRFISQAIKIHPSFEHYTTGHYFRGVS